MKGILLDGNGEFQLSGGCIEVGEADGQTIENLLKANRGEFKEAPFIGGEVTRMQNGQTSAMWCARVKKQIQSVGLPVSDVTMTDNQIEVRQ